MWNLVVVVFLITSVFSGKSSAQNFDSGPLTRLVDCTAFAVSLQAYYEDYRSATGDNQFAKEEERALVIRDVLVSALYQRAERELRQQRDADIMNAQMAWNYDTAKSLPERVGFGNSVVIFENRIQDCILDYGLPYGS